MYYVALRNIHVTIVTMGKFEYVFVALVMQDAKGLCCVMLSMTSLALQHDFWEKLWNTKCVFWFPPHLLSETFLILRRA